MAAPLNSGEEVAEARGSCRAEGQQEAQPAEPSVREEGEEAQAALSDGSGHGCRRDSPQSGLPEKSHFQGVFYWGWVGKGVFCGQTTQGHRGSISALQTEP